MKRRPPRSTLFPYTPLFRSGYNVYPREVEEVLEGCPGFSEVAVVGLPDPEFGEQVVAAVVRDDPGLTAERVAELCREHLARYKRPRRVVFVDALPRNALGKVLKHEVRDRKSTRLNSSHANIS